MQCEWGKGGSENTRLQAVRVPRSRRISCDTQANPQAPAHPGLASRGRAGLWLRGETLRCLPSDTPEGDGDGSGRDREPFGEQMWRGPRRGWGAQEVTGGGEYTGLSFPLTAELPSAPSEQMLSESCCTQHPTLLSSTLWGGRGETRPKRSGLNRIEHLNI